MKRTLLFVLVPFLSGCGLVFVNGPPSGWQEIQDVDALTTMALNQPCTSSRTLVWVDGVVAAAGVISAFERPTDDSPGYTTPQEVQAGVERIFSVVAGVAAAVGAAAGLTKVNDCRAFNARLLELRRSGAVGFASYQWLDELSPPHDLGATAFDSVFGVPMIQSLGFRSNEATGN